jgi:hypothetical protein
MSKRPALIPIRHDLRAYILSKSPISIKRHCKNHQTVISEFRHRTPEQPAILSRFGVSPALSLTAVATTHLRELGLSGLALFTVTHLYKLSIASAIQPQFNPLILPACALHTLPYSYKPSCTLGLFSPATVVTSLYLRVARYVTIPRSSTTHLLPRSLRRIILSRSLPQSIYLRLSLCNSY